VRVFVFWAVGSLALAACGEEPRLDSEPPPAEESESGDDELGVDVPSEAEAEQAAREAIGPKDFDAELERIKAELRDDQ
jgi:hypothetical protein